MTVRAHTRLKIRSNALNEPAQSSPFKLLLFMRRSQLQISYCHPPILAPKPNDQRAPSAIVRLHSATFAFCKRKILFLPRVELSANFGFKPAKPWVSEALS